VGLIAYSEYFAATDMDKCVHCGECVSRCYFHARIFDNEMMSYDAQKCYGCGLCISVCQANATLMDLRMRQKDYD
jgi:heterodisulfide reductase subunit A-like polyferredoxin